MSSEVANLNDWMMRISRAKTRKEMFSILDEFRVLEWSDEERAMVAKHYIRLVDKVDSGYSASDADDASTKPQNADAGADGPVWYEKM